VIIPSIDIMNGKAVQLVQGEKMALQAAEDPIALAKQFGMTGEVAVIDLDAAMGQGDNRDLIKTLCRHAPCRVGGGIRSLEAASDWLNAGAVKVILGTKAEPAILSQLPRDRVMAAVDMRGGKVAVEGWKTVQETSGLTRMAELRDWVGGFLVTNIDIEGTMGGFDTAAVAPILDAASTVKLTMAGGITTAQQIAELDRMGVDAQVGMALYTGKLTIADCLAAMMISDRADGLWPTVVVDSNHQALGLVYSNGESLQAALAEGAGIYHSRSRGGLWRKGETSGARQKLLRIAVDCDRDALQFTVQQLGDGFCHLGTASCFEADFGTNGGISALAQRIDRAMQAKDAQSYTQRLLAEPGLLNAKIQEEGGELAMANSVQEIVAETADVLYFAAVKLAQQHIPWSAVWDELNSRARKLTRRGGDRKATS